MVGITSAVVVWPPGVEPLPAKRYSGMGRPPVMPRRTRAASADERQGAGHGPALRPSRRSAGARAPTKRSAVALRRCAFDMLVATPARLGCSPGSGCSSSGPPARPSRPNTGYPRCPRTPRSMIWSAPRITLAHRARLPGSQAGIRPGPLRRRGWRGFHHHAIAVHCGLWVPDGSTTDRRTSAGGKKNFIERQVPALPANYIPRGSPARAAPRRGLDTLRCAIARLRALARMGSARAAVAKSPQMMLRDTVRLGKF